MWCEFWYFIIDNWDEFDENVSNIILNLWWYNDLNAIDVIDAIDTIKFVDVIDAIKFIGVIENLIENVIKQMTCVLVIKINKCDDDIDVDINLNVIDKIKSMSKKLNIIVTKTNVTNKLT